MALASRGVGAETIQGVHRCVRSCLAEAVRRQKMQRNPALVARPHRSDHHEVQPLSLAEAKAVLAVAANRRNSLRWQIALAVGLAKVKPSACSGPTSTSLAAPCVSGGRCGEVHGGTAATPSAHAACGRSAVHGVTVAG